MQARTLQLWVAGAVLLAAAGGCSRLSTLESRVATIGDPEARLLIQNALWVGGSKYAWTKHDTMRAEVTWTEHTPQGDVSTDEVWLVGLWDGTVRIEMPAPGLPSRERELAGAAARREVTVFDGAKWRTYVAGIESADPAAKSRARLAARLARELLIMPFAMTGPGLRIQYVGTREGPGEAKVWERLLVTYASEAGHPAGDRMVVEILKATRQVDSVTLQWHEYPLSGRLLRVDLKLWQAADGISTSRLWQVRPVDDQGRVTGDEWFTIRVNRVEFDAGAGGRTSD
jgi:hypothetical protein